jgi:hypothetical protein
MKTKVVSAIYCKLHNTKFGGRPSRGYHYIHSLKSLLKMNEADFVVYTSEEEYDDVKGHLGEHANLTLKIFDLENHNWKELFDQYKDYEEAKRGDRCIELQYMKLYWLKEENTDGYDRIYWFDAGLSYTGIIPDKYIDCKGAYVSGDDYYKSELFNNNFLANLNKITENKLFVITKENQLNFWNQQPRECFDNEYDGKWHVIGGVFGGDTKLIDDLFAKFSDAIECIITKYKRIQWHEENLLTTIFYNYSDMFVNDYFDVWTHENNFQHHGNNQTIEEYFIEKKSFYKVLENLQ